MALKQWFENLTNVDCVGPQSTWNDMVDYIQHSSCATFTIYGTCTDTDQIFKFDNVGALSRMTGGDTSGDDLTIIANSVNAEPYLRLDGNSYIQMRSADSIYLDHDTDDFLYIREANTQYLKTYRDSASYIEGQAGTGADLILKANSTDAYPIIELMGNDVINLKSKTDILFYEEAVQMFRFELNGANSIIYGGASTGDDILIYANDTDTAPLITMRGNSNLFLTTAGEIIFSDGADRICSFDRVGADGAIYGPDSTGANLYIYANDTDAEPYISLNGNNTIDILHGATASIKLWENAGAPQNYMKFQCVGVTQGTLYGPPDTTDDLFIYANQTDAYPYISMLGNNDINYWAAATRFHKFLIATEQVAVFGVDASGNALWYGGNNDNEDLTIYANSADVTTRIEMLGQSHLYLYAGQNMYLDHNSSSSIFMREGGAVYMQYYQSGTDSVIGTQNSNFNLYLNPHGTGLVKFGTYSALSGETVTGYMDVLDSGGTPRKLAVVA